MAPALVHAIKSQGLVLVVNKYEASNRSSHLPEGADGVLHKNGVLRFNEKISLPQ